MSVATPTLTVERDLLRESTIVIACDEVGRGALAGPVAVGAVALDADALHHGVPEGVRDSKLVPPGRRSEVAARACAWVPASAVGWASSTEIDEIGIMRALGLAAVRALADLAAHGVPVSDAIVLLDGTHDYISASSRRALRVRPRAKADRDCASAAAASVIAKVSRDTLMEYLHEELPDYHWDRNKGYASADHRRALQEIGVSAHHRSSWSFAAAPTLV